VPGHEVIGRVDALGAHVRGMDRRPAGRGRLAWGQLRLLRQLPSR
jgi:hypothetical protein